MQNIYDLVDLGDLNAFIRGLQFPDLTLGRWLPNVGVDRNFYRYVLNDRSQRAAARYIAFDAEAPIAGRPGLSVRMGELPPIKEKSVLTESDQWLQEALSDVIPDTALATVFSDAALRVRAILQRLELAKGEALSKGKVTIDEGGQHLLPVAFGTPSPQMDVAPLTLWSDTEASTPLTNMVAWRAICIANGFTPEATLTSQAVTSLLQRNKEIRDFYGNDRKFITRDELNAVLASEGFPTIDAPYDAQYKNPGGSLTRAIDANRFVWLPANGQGFGEAQFGRTREAVELGGNGVDFGQIGGTPGPVVVTMKSFDPVEIWVKAAAITLPVIQTPDQMFSAVVTA